MTIQVELSPQAEAKLASAASAHGIAPATYAGHLLNQMLAPGIEASGKLSVDQFHAMLEALGEGSHDLPDLPTESFTRESFHQDRA